LKQRRKRIFSVRAKLLLVLLFLAAAPMGIPAQDRNFDGWDLAVDPSYIPNPDRQIIRTFRVLEDPDARRQIERAEQNIASSDFLQAVYELHAVITTCGEKVFPSGRDSPGGSRSCRFIGAAEYARFILTRLPDPGRETYEAFAEEKGRGRLEKARSILDVRALESVAAAFSCSRVGRDAYVFLADISLERGDPDRAVFFLKKSLLYNGDEDGTVTLRLARALDQAGLDGDALEYLAAAEAGSASLPDLGKDLEANPPLHLPATGDWLTMGGAGHRNQPMELSPGAGFSKTSWMARTFNERLHKVHPFKDSEIDSVPFFPIRSGEVLVMNDSVSSRAYSIHSGELLWLYEGPLEAGHESNEIITLREYTRKGFAKQAGTISDNLIAGGTAADGIVLVNLQAARPKMKKKLLYRDVINKPIPVRSLFALSEMDGQLLWRFGGTSPDPDSFESLLSLPSPPVVKGDRVYCDGHQIEGGIRIFLFCLDLATGEKVWQTPVGIGQQELTMFNMDFKEFTATPITEKGGTLYICSNLGFVAAVDALAGEIRWITEYESMPIPQAGHYTEPRPRPVFWANTPPLVSKDVLVTTPLDSSSIVAFNRHTGKILWRVPRERIWRTGYRRLAGIRGDKVIVSGQGGAVALSLTSGAKLWSTPALADASSCIGRGAMTEDKLYVNLSDLIVAVDLATGKIIEEIQTAEILDCFRNLFFMGEVAVGVTDDAIQVSFDSRRLLEHLLFLLQQNEGTFEDLAFVGDIYKIEGDYDAAARYYQKALEKGDGRDSADLYRVRSGLFNVHFSNGTRSLDVGLRREAAKAFRAAKKYAPDDTAFIKASVQLVKIHLALSSGKEGDENRLAEIADSLDRRCGQMVYDFEGLCGAGPARVGYFAALIRHRLARDTGRPDKVISALHDLLDNHPQEWYLLGDAREPASEWARKSIARIVEKEGRAVYRRFEARARAEFDEALSAGSAELLGSVARRYPNSSVAARAVLERARILISDWDAADAYGALCSLLGDGGDATLEPHALFLLGRAAEVENNPDLARSFYERLRRKHAAVVSLWESDRTYGSLIPERMGESPPAPSLPAAALPRGEIKSREWDFKAPYVKIVDLEGAASSSFQNDKVLLYTNEPERLILFDYDTGQVVWNIIPDRRELGEPLSVFCTGDMAAVCYDEVVLGLNATTGERIWKRQFEGWYTSDFGSGLILVVSLTDRDGVVKVECINPVTGSTLWTRRVEECPTLEVVPTNETFALLVHDTHLLIIDPLTGREVCRTFLDCDVAGAMPFTSPPGHIVLRLEREAWGEKKGERSLAVIDPETGQVVWTVLLGENPGNVLLASTSLVAVVDADGGWDADGSRVRSRRLDKRVLNIDLLTGGINGVTTLSATHYFFSGGTVLAGDWIFLRPRRFTHRLPVSSVELETGDLAFRNVLLDMDGEGKGRSPSLKEGIYAADGLIVVAEFLPSISGPTALFGRVFLLDGATGKVVFQKDIRRSGKGVSRHRLRSRDRVEARLRTNAVLVTSGTRLICIRGE